MPKHKNHPPHTTTSTTTTSQQQPNNNNNNITKQSSTTASTARRGSTTTATTTAPVIKKETEVKKDDPTSNNSRNIHEELRNELFAEAMVFPDSISFYYVNEPVKKPTQQLSYLDVVNKPNTTKEPEKKIPRLEEFTIDDPEKIDCTRKIQMIYICTVNYTDENSPMYKQYVDHFSEEIKRPENKQSSVKLIVT